MMDFAIMQKGEPMSDLIRLEDVLAIIDKRTVKGKLQVAREVLKLPTIEPERKKGKWIDYHTTCSECGWQMIDDVIESPNMVAFNFCPNCGAEMTEDKE